MVHPMEDEVHQSDEWECPECGSVYCVVLQELFPAAE